SDSCLPLQDHGAAPRRHRGDRHARRRGRPARSASLDEAGRPGGSGDRPHRHSSERGGRDRAGGLMATPPPPGFPASSPSPTPSTPAARADAAGALVARLSRLDACAVSDALDKLDLPGCVTGLAPLSVARRIAGRVRTVKLVAAEQLVAADGPPRHLGTTAVMAGRPGEV